jgi:hypothetical protein
MPAAGPVTVRDSGAGSTTRAARARPTRQAWMIWTSRRDRSSSRSTEHSATTTISTATRTPARLPSLSDAGAARRQISCMDPIPDDAARSGGFYHQCMQELQSHTRTTPWSGARDTQPRRNVTGGSWAGGRVQPPDHPRAKTLNSGRGSSTNALSNKSLDDTQTPGALARLTSYDAPAQAEDCAHRGDAAKLRQFAEVRRDRLWSSE